MTYQPYDLDRFVGQVQQLLLENGARPQVQGDPHPRHAAAVLLRAFGLDPTMDRETALRLSMDAPSWEEKDEERARRIRDRDTEL